MDASTLINRVRPSAPDAARRLLILLTINSHALRLLMIWDFVFQTRQTMLDMTGQSPAWQGLGSKGEWMKLRAQWNWFWERNAVRRALKAAGLFPYLTGEEREFLGLDVSEQSRGVACQFLWQIEAAACIAWALELLPRLWPMDEPFSGKLDIATLDRPERRLVNTAVLRPYTEVEAARDHVKLWHWRARQLQLERAGYAWPPPDATPKAVSDLQSKGLATMDGIVRATARLLREKGVLSETVEDDFVAKAKAYRDLSEEDASELRSIALERHRALNWLCGAAPSNDWSAVPTET